MDGDFGCCVASTATVRDDYEISAISAGRASAIAAGRTSANQRVIDSWFDFSETFFVARPK